MFNGSQQSKTLQYKQAISHTPPKPDKSPTLEQ